MSELNGIKKDVEWIRETLERLVGRFDTFDTGCRARHSKIDIDLSALKVRCTLYGALAGAAPALTTIIVLFAKGVI